MKLIKDNLLKVTLFSIILGVIFLMISNGKYVLFPQENKIIEPNKVIKIRGFFKIFTIKTNKV